MPFADFLADLGQVRRGGAGMLGLVGETLGGKTREQRGVDAFNQELPKIYEAFDRATTKQEIEQAGRVFTDAWIKAGGPMDERYDKFSERLVKPALNRVQQADLEGIRRDYGARPAESRPEGTEGPITQEGNFIDPRVERPLDQAGALRVFQATGASPQHFQSILETPSKVTENLAQGRSHAATAGQKEYELSQQRRLENIQLPGSAGEAGMTAGMLATPHGGAVGSYMTGLNPQREPSGAALDLKRQGLDIQQQRLQVLADRVASGQATAAEKLQLEQARLDLSRQKFEQDKLGSETEREPPLNAADTEIFMNAIREEAVRTGKTSPEDLKALAAKRGLILEGTPTIEETGGIRGFFTDKSLGGSMRLRRAPVVTTKKPGQAPTGQPSPSAKASGGAPVAPRPGTVIQGYRFKGGDPANQANWEQVR